MKSSEMKKQLSSAPNDALLKLLKARFEANMDRHKGMDWAKVQAKLEANADKLRSLHEMENTGGEPDVVGLDKKTGEYTFFDCSPETPKGRTSICYDREGLESRKEHKPKNNAIDMAADMGIEILTEEQYRSLQQLGEFDCQDLKLGENARRYQRTWRRSVLRSPLRARFRLSQRGSVVLRCKGVSRIAEGLNKGFGFQLACEPSGREIAPCHMNGRKPDDNRRLGAEDPAAEEPGTGLARER